MVQLSQNKISSMNSFSDNIISWYKEYGRHDLPWRKNISPYSIWISEIMLQQTQVKTVIPYFKKFIKKYPNLEALLLASEDEILAQWSGLGFYRRAKNIYKACRVIGKNFNNKLPTNINDLKSRPEIENLIGIYSSLSKKKIDFLLNEFDKKDFSFFKEKLSSLIVEKISPISKEIKKINQDPSYIDKVLQDGGEKAYELSSKKIKDIKKKFGF